MFAWSGSNFECTEDDHASNRKAESALQARRVKLWGTMSGAERGPDVCEPNVITTIELVHCYYSCKASICNMMQSACLQCHLHLGNTSIAANAACRSVSLLSSASVPERQDFILSKAIEQDFYHNCNKRTSALHSSPDNWNVEYTSK